MPKKLKKSVEPTAAKQTEKPPRRTVFISLRWKLLIGFTLLFSIVFALAFIWFYNFATNQAWKRIQADLVDTIQGAAGSINAEALASVAKDGQPNAAGQAWLAVSAAEDNETADAASLRESATNNYGVSFAENNKNGFSDDPRYQELMNQLQEIHNIEPRAWPYLFVKSVADPNDTHITYIADLWARYDPSHATPFLYILLSKKSYKGLNELTLRLNDQGKFMTYEDQWGKWVSAYAPVRNSAGESVGAIGIDFEASYVNQVQAAIRQQIIWAFLITYAGLFVLVFLISFTLTRPIQKLTVSAERLGEGDYSQDMTKYNPSGFVRDEIVRLADIFAIMAGKVYQREQNLRKQVEMLKIEIDEVKKQKQVSEIADTDFFRELKTKAQKMRKRNAG